MRNTILFKLAAVAVIGVLAGCGGSGSSKTGGGNGGGTIGEVKPSVVGPGAGAFDPSGKFAYVIESQTHAIAQYGVNTDGSLTKLSPASVDNGFTAVDLKTVQTATGKFAYATDPLNNKISQYKINADGTLSALTPAAITSTGAAPYAIAVDPGNRFLYTTSDAASSSQGVSAYSINADGTLTSLGPELRVGQQIYEITISPDGKWMFTNRGFNHDVVVIKIQSDGTLTVVGGIGSGTGSAIIYRGFAVNAAGTLLYAFAGSNTGIPSQIETYAISAAGALTPAGAPVLVPDGFGLVMTPDGKFLYGSDFTGAGVSQTRINTDGTLTALTPPTTAADGPIDAIALSPDGKRLFASHKAANFIDLFSVNADGTLTLLK
ncbi:MAG: hypothetical protein JWN14_4083 [Chthonomonadales bacterium]|nr:hypothetical protein [Chthonomonadales bacterium]